jgi:hypothetical protein
VGRQSLTEFLASAVLLGQIRPYGRGLECADSQSLKPCCVQQYCVALRLSNY